ncbi:MAG: cell division protein FtsQ/DivIB [Proteobacteria bacterium]|nr:cell division protein FtsQ/DivIB [Pseudomonadota bacterium]HQR04364.1 cell division protein FtsQ/DivIB [Rhodocyclaceae bacterium]
MAKARTAASSSHSPVPSAEGFWDKPALLNILADLLFLVAFVLLGWAAWQELRHLPWFPLRQVVVQGSLNQVTRQQVEYAVRSSVTGTFFTVSLDGVRASFEKLPWVRRADVRRLWPDTLELNLEEQVAAARWKQADGESRLVNTRGEIFAAASEADLPVLSGPEGSASHMLDRYRAFDGILQAIGRHPQALTLSSREAWEIRLDDGLTLELGREEGRRPVEERLDRFVANFAELGQKLHARPTLIDMRYPNGFALRTVPGIPVAARAGRT